MIVSLCDIIFMCDHIHSSAKRALKFRPSFKLSKSYPLLKVMHAYQSFLEHNSKAQSYRSMDQLGMCCVKRGEGFCYVDCNISNIFHFGLTKLSWNSK